MKMNSQMKTLGLLPVRGGSLGLPGKNSRVLAGKPLMAWAAEALSASPQLDYAFCSTDSPELAEIAVSCGLPSFPLRPAKLATATSLVFDTVQFVLKYFQGQGKYFDQLVLVQATSPFVTPTDIENTLNLLRDPTVDSVVSVARVSDDYHPSLMYRSTNAGLLIAGDPEDTFVRRQDRQPWFRRVGLVVAIRVETMIRYGALVGGEVRLLEVEPDRAINIDDENGFSEAERLAERHL